MSCQIAETIMSHVMFICKQENSHRYATNKGHLPGTRNGAMGIYPRVIKWMQRIVPDLGHKGNPWN